MLTYNMEERGDESLYAYLYRCVKADIESGAIAAGQRLPSKRALAQNLGVSVITVEGAYAQLVAEGYVNARQRSGYYASELPERPAAPALAASARTGEVRQTSGGSRQLHRDSLKQAAWEAGGKDGHANTRSPALMADFSDGSLASPETTAALWGRAVRAAMSEEPASELFANLPAAGHLRLRQAIAQHVQAFRGMQVNPECIVVGAGAQLFYTLLAQMLLRGRLGAMPADGVQAVGQGQGVDAVGFEGGAPIIAVEDPGYSRIGKAYSAAGLQVCGLPLDDQGIRMDALVASGAQAVHVMPSHQFPTGVVTAAARRYELLGWAAACPGRIIVEDDYDCEFRLSGRPVPSLASIDTCAAVVYLNTFSKSLSSALRVAYVVLPPQLMQLFEDEFGFYANTVSALDQIVLARLIESGEYERHINRVRTQHRLVRDVLVGELQSSIVADRLCFHGLDAGLHFVLEVCTDESAEALAARALGQGIRLAPLSQYRNRGHGAGAGGVSHPLVTEAGGVPHPASNRGPRNRGRGCITSGCVASAEPGNPRFVMQYGSLDQDGARVAAQVLAHVLAAAKG